jgi:hypothetical protein
MSTDLGYIIVATRDDNTRWYMGTDASSGGYEYFAKNAEDAQWYPSLGEAERQIKRRLGDTFVHLASGATYENPVRTVNVAVEVITASQFGYSVNFEFEVIPPTAATAPNKTWKALA